MTNRQKRAIWYAIRERELAYQMQLIQKNGLADEFKKSRYKSPLWFLRSKGINPYGRA